MLLKMIIENSVSIIFCSYSSISGIRRSEMVNVLDSEASHLGLKTSWVNCVVFVINTIYSHSATLHSVLISTGELIIMITLTITIMIMITSKSPADL